LIKKNEAGMKLGFLRFSLILISIALSQLTTYTLDRKITKRSKCPEKILASSNEVKTQAVPYKIVFKPWNGRHNVHGIFMLPVEDKSAKILVVRIPGAGTFCGGAHNVGTSFEGIQAKPGYYLIKTNFRTRTSIWLIARGFPIQLKDSRNWILANY
jgi:hypothetical protein